MKKRVLSLLLALCLCLGLLPTAALAAEESEFVIENGVLTQYNGPGGDVVIPDEVTAIGESVFARCNNLSSVSLPESLRSIGNKAFSGTSLKTVVLPRDLETLGEDAFSMCRSLTDVTIGRVAETCRAFSGCSSLTSVTLLDDLETLPETTLCKVLYPDFSIGQSSSVATGQTYMALNKYTGTASHVEIPEGVTEITSQAFRDCTDLTSVTFPKSLTRISGQRIFKGCTSLTEVTIPDTVTELDWAVFDGSSIQRLYLPAHLMDVRLTLPAGCAKIGADDTVSSDCLVREGKLVQYIGSGGRVVIPDGVTEIADRVFYENTAITEVVIPDGVKTIGERAFFGCTGLTRVNIPDSVERVGNAFYGCTSLAQVDLPSRLADDALFSKDTKVNLVGHEFQIENSVLKGYKGPGGDVVIPDTVTSIASGAFGEKSGVVRLTIPSTVNELRFGIVSNCYTLKDVVIPASVTKIDTRAFEYHHEGMAMNGILSNVTIHGAAGSFAESWVNTTKVGAVKLAGDPYNYTFVADQGWNVAPEATKHNFTIENGVLKSYTGPGGDVVVPDGVTELAYGVLDGLGALNSLTLPAGIKKVNISNPYVKRITVGDGAETVGLTCPALECVTLPDSVKSLSITSNVLRELVIPAGVTGWPHLSCPRLRKLTFPTDNWVFKGISRADFMAKISNCPALDEIVNCPNEFVDDLIAPNKILRDNWTNPQSTIVAQSDRIVKLSNEITAGLTTDYDKAKAISQWVVDHIKYDDDYYYEGLKDYSDVPFDPQEILDKGKAVCAGFARLTQALLVAQKIPCLYVLGNTSAGYHAWNLALIDGEYLWIDNTWGMKYFGLGVYAISEDHQATGAASFNNVKGPGTLVQTEGTTQTQAMTEEEQKVRAAIEALKTDYPEGMRWTNSNSYTSKALSSTGYGCAGFAYLCSDAAFGDAPITKTHSNFDEIRVGDILRINNGTHSVVVLEKRSGSVIVTEGNYSGSIHWGREISKADLEKGKFVATSRWGGEQQANLEGVSDWAAEEVTAAVQAQLVPQDIQNNYTVSITRQDFCRLMVQLVEKASGKGIRDYLKDKGLTVSSPFTDTDNDQVLAAYTLGIVKGTSATTFTPAGSITRQEAATMLARTAKLLGAVPSDQEKQFQDSARVASWAAEGVALVTRLAAPQTGHTVMGGTGDNYFSPLASYSREQAILTAYRLYLNVNR